MYYHLLQLFKLCLQHEFAKQKITIAILSLVLSHMWGVFTAYFSEINWKTQETFPPFRQHGELIFLQDLYFVAGIYFVWTTRLQIVLENIHFPYLFLMLEPWTVKTTVAMGAWLNIVMTQELCWKGGELWFQSLFSSAFLGFIQRWSEVKCTNSSGHMAQESSFSKSRILLSTMTHSQSVLLKYSCL